MIRRKSPKDGYQFQSLNEDSFTNKKGIDVTQAPPMRDFVFDAENLDVNLDGSMSLRKIISASTLLNTSNNRVFELYNTDYYIKINIVGTNPYDYKFYVIDTDNNTLPVKIRYKGVLYDYNPNSQFYNRPGITFEDAQSINTQTSSIVYNVSLDLNRFLNGIAKPEYLNINDVKAYFRLVIEDINGVITAVLDYIDPYVPNLVRTESTVSFNTNTAGYYTYALKDTYNETVNSVQGILAYTNGTGTKVCQLTETDAYGHYIISVLDKDDLNSRDLYLKAFCNFNNQVPGVKFYCCWEYTTDGVHYYEVPEFISQWENDSSAIYVYVEDLTSIAESLNSTDNDKTYMSRLVVDLDVINNSTDALTTRPDVLHFPSGISGATYRFTMYSISMSTYTVNSSIIYKLSNTNADNSIYYKDSDDPDVLKNESFDIELHLPVDTDLSNLKARFAYQNKYDASQTLLDVPISTVVTLTSTEKVVRITGSPEAPVEALQSHNMLCNIKKCQLLIYRENKRIYTVAYEVYDVYGVFGNTQQDTLNGLIGNTSAYSNLTYEMHYNSLNTEFYVHVYFDFQGQFLNYGNTTYMLDSTSLTNVTKHLLTQDTYRRDGSFRVNPMGLDKPSATQVWTDLIDALDSHRSETITTYLFVHVRCMRLGSIYKNFTYVHKTSSPGYVYDRFAPYMSLTDYNSTDRYVYHTNIADGQIWNEDYKNIHNPTEASLIPYSDEMYYLSINGEFVFEYGSTIGSETQIMDAIIAGDGYVNPNAASLYIPVDNMIATELSFMPYTQLVADEEDILNKDFVNTVGGEKLYYKYKLYSYGEDSFKNNIYVSDSNSFITSLLNTIDLPMAQDSKVTALVPWRDYLIAASDTGLYLITPQGGNSYTSKIINTFIGIPWNDRKTAKAILNGLIFKSGTKVYSVQPSMYASDDSILNIIDISKPVAPYITDYTAVENLAFTTEQHYYLCMPNPTAGTTSVLKYEYASRIWTKHKYPVLFKDVVVNTVDDIRVITNSGIYLFNQDSDSEQYGDKIYSDSVTPFEFYVDTGQKSYSMNLIKQFVESKLTFALTDIRDELPLTVDIYVDQYTPILHQDVSSSSSFWKNIDSVIALGTSIPASHKDAETAKTYIDNPVMKQLFLRFSAKGYTIRHVVSGVSHNQFKFYVSYYRYKSTSNKQ